MGWYDIVFVKSSKNKKAILKALLATPMTPAELAKKLLEKVSSKSLFSAEKSLGKNALIAQSLFAYWQKALGKNASQKVAINILYMPQET